MPSGFWYAYLVAVPVAHSMVTSDMPHQGYINQCVLNMYLDKPFYFYKGKHAPRSNWPFHKMLGYKNSG